MMRCRCAGISSVETVIPMKYEACRAVRRRLSHQVLLTGDEPRLKVPQGSININSS